MQTNRKEHQAIEQQYKQVQSALSKQKDRLSQAIEVHNQSTKRIREIDSQIHQLQADEQKVIRSIQKQDGQIQAAQLKIQQLKGEQDELEIKLGDVANDIQDFEVQKAQLEHELSTFDSQIEKQTALHLAAVNASDDKQKQIRDERKRLTELDQQFQKSRQLSSLSGEIDGVMRIHKRHDGLSGAAKNLLSHPPCQRCPGGQNTDTRRSDGLGFCGFEWCSRCGVMRHAEGCSGTRQTKQESGHRSCIGWPRTLLSSLFA